MASRSFPDAYLGGVPTLAHFQGRERWERERADALTRHEQALQQWLDPARAETPLRLAGWAGCQRDLALLSCWEGRAEQAHEQMAASVETTLRCIELAWPTLDSTDYCGLALDGAMAASLVGQDDHATTLFTYAARFASGLVTEDDQRPARRWVSLAPFIDDAIVQAYSLLRLGRLSGFHATLYPAPFPEARKVAPAWAAADISRLLATIDTAVEVARSKREPADLSLRSGSSVCRWVMRLPIHAPLLSTVRSTRERNQLPRYGAAPPHIRTTIFPTLCRDSIRRCASAIWSNEKVAPTRGRISCAATNAMSSPQTRASRGGLASR